MNNEKCVVTTEELLAGGKAVTAQCSCSDSGFSRQQQTQSDLSGQRAGTFLCPEVTSQLPPVLPAGATRLHPVLFHTYVLKQSICREEKMNNIIHLVISYLCTKQSPSNICHFCLHRSCVNSFQRYSFL